MGKIVDIKEVDEEEYQTRNTNIKVMYEVTRGNENPRIEVFKTKQGWWFIYIYCDDNSSDPRFYAAGSDEKEAFILVGLAIMDYRILQDDV
jgi:hypothetical protein